MAAGQPSLWFPLTMPAEVANSNLFSSLQVDLHGKTLSHAINLRHESFRLNQTHNLVTIVVYDAKNVVAKAILYRRNRVRFFHDASSTHYKNRA